MAFCIIIYQNIIFSNFIMNDVKLTRLIYFPIKNFENIFVWQFFYMTSYQLCLAMASWLIGTLSGAITGAMIVGRRTARKATGDYAELLIWPAAMIGAGGGGIIGGALGVLYDKFIKPRYAIKIEKKSIEQKN